MAFDLRAVTESFQTGGEFIRGGSYGTGHIHDTFAVYCDGKDKVRRYLLQRINENVFRDCRKLMENIERVTSHIREKLKEEGAPDPERRVLTPVRTREGELLHADGKGHLWRMYLFIEEATAHDTLRDLDHAFEAARAFGEFQRQLQDLPGPPLHETIPDFHNGPKRLEAFERAVAGDPRHRARLASREIDFVRRNASVFRVLPDLSAKGELPLRITHNDTKINNVMLDNLTGKRVCVIDLDTVMAGFSLYDFGDIVRSSGCDAAEDEQDLSRVRIDPARFEAILRGYLSSAGDFLKPVERVHLIHGGELMTLMVGTRFLTDFLEGDRYFKIHRENHNLERCRTQFRLVESIQEGGDPLRRIVESVSGTS